MRAALEGRHLPVVVLAAALAAGLVCAAATAMACYCATGYAVLAARSAAVAGACAFAACAAFGAVFAWDARRRSRRVLELAERLDRIVRDPSCVQSFDDYQEGELAILANELQKACVLLRDQAGALRTERDALADSLADISHQLRTPLMSMNLALDLLGRPDTPPERRRALIQELHRTSDHMNWLVTALLTLARADAGTLHLVEAPVDLAQVARDVASTLAVAFELADVRLELRCPERVDPVTGDAGWCREAVSNVVKNCLEHTPAGGTVRVEVSQDVVATRVVVSDTGPGIDPRDLPHLFERFYKGAGSSEGSFGIGLALARCLTAAQGATLQAANNPAGGARFTFTFPHLSAL